MATAQPATAAQPAGQPPPYIMGVLPFVPTANIEAIFAPLAAELSRALGRPVKLRTSPSFDKYMDELKNRTFDIAYIQPFDYVDISKPGGYLPLASRNDTLSSHIVVKNDSPAKTLKDLRGKNLGMPPRVSAVSFLNRITLKKAGLIPETDVKMVFLSSHQACLQQLMIGAVDACGVSPAGARLGEQQFKTTFRLIHESMEIPTPLFVVKKELPAKDRDTILHVLTSTDLATVKPELRSMFVESNGKPFKKVTDGEYDVIRRLMKSYGIK
jgi:phosphonate transport system substrate-binding protein